MARKEDGTIYFDEEEQKVFDKAVQDRLSRVEKKPEDYDILKEISDDIGEFFEGATPSEKKESIKAYKEQVRQAKELADLEEKAEDEGLTPAQAKKMKALEDSIEKLNKTIGEITGERKAIKDAEDLTKTQQENWTKQVTEFNTTYEDIDLKVLEADEDFIEYATGRTGTLTTLYEGYVKFTSKLEKKTADEIREKYKSKELLSTGTGKGSKTESGDYGLTERQKQLAKSDGQSYKEFSDRLKNAE